MTLRDFIFNYLDVDTIVNIRIRPDKVIRSVTLPNFVYTRGDVLTLLHDDKYAYLLNGEVTHVKPSYHRYEGNLDITVDLEDDDGGSQETLTSDI